MAKGNRAKKGEPGRPAHVGFQPGHPPYYTGGSVPGHAPTNRNPDPSPLLAQLKDPTSAAYPWRFDQPLGRENRKKGGNRPKDKERECLEALQNGKDPEKLKKRFPVMMVARLVVLSEIALEPGHKDCLNAQRLIREILGRLRGARVDEKGFDQEEAIGVASIELRPGHADVRAPGLERVEGPPEPPPPVAVHGNGNGKH